MPLLPSLFAGALPASPSPPFILITDSILQPGLPLLRSLVADSLGRNEAVVVLALEQTASRLLSGSFDASRVEFVDCVAAGVDLHAAGGPRRVEVAALSALRARKKAGGKILVVVDSVDELAEAGVDVVYALVRRILKELQGVAGARLVALHHAWFPSPASTSLSAFLVPTLLSPATSSSTIHLTLHPCALLELLSRDYGIAIPLHPTSAAPLDLRLPSFLASFASRSWGDPFVLPPGPDKDDERVPLDQGGKAGGKCIVEWTARDIAVASDDAKRGEPRKIVAWGLEGLRESSGRLEPVGLGEVLSAERMARVNLSTSFASTPATISKPTDPPLPFNLSLTDSQKAAREEVVLPYLPREDGQVPGLMAGGGVEYVPDEGDDMDDDDPDEDLEV